jgi:hypothetical protein
MTKEYIHDLNKEVRSIAGWYTLYKEERVSHRGRDYLYLVGDGAVETSCCGTAGCHYAVVPGAVVRWKSKTNEKGLPISLVEPLTDEEVRAELKEIVSKREGVSQVQFW